MNPFYLSLLCSLVVAIVAIPTIIRISYLKHLYDVPDDRKAHGKVIPTLGGLAVFAGFSISLCVFASDTANFSEYKYLLGGILIIFFIGLKDDILIISPLKKLLGQIASSFLIVVMGGVKLTSMYGLFGIYELENSYSLALSIFTLLVIMNGFNLIDGINWLCGSIGITVSLAFGLFFFINGYDNIAIIASSLIGGLLGFMWFNKTPAKIFMGDTGSLIIGLINGVLAIYFIELNPTAPVISFDSSPIIAFGVMILPLFDTLRVFLLRMLKGNSPFSPDRNHVHHQLLEIGLSHMKSSGILMLSNVLIIVGLFFMHDKINDIALLVLLLASVSILSYIPMMMIKKRKKKMRLQKKLESKTSPSPLSKVS